MAPFVPFAQVGRPHRHESWAAPGAALAAVLLLASASACAPAVPANPAGSAGTGSTQDRPLRKIQVHVAALGVPYAHHLVAMEKGYYAEEGLAIELVNTAGAQGIASVLSGETHFTTSGGAALSAILKGADMKVIFTHNDSPGYQLWSSRSDVKTVADLPGKAVGINSRGDAMELSTRLVLMRAGLDPNSVAYTPLNTGSARLAALQSGGVAGAILGIADVQKFKEIGTPGQMLVDISRDVKMLFNGAATSGTLLRDDPDLVFRFLRATVKGREYVKQFKDQTLDVVGKHNGASREVNEPDYEVVLATMTADGTLPEQVQLADATVRLGLIGAETLRPLAEMYDYRPVTRVYAELARSGWSPRP